MLDNKKGLDRAIKLLEAKVCKSHKLNTQYRYII